MRIIITIAPFQMIGDSIAEKFWVHPFSSTILVTWDVARSALSLNLDNVN